MASDIGIGGNGDVWITGKKRIGPEGYNILKWCPMSKKWKYYPGIGARISVDGNGIPWVV